MVRAAACSGVSPASSDSIDLKLKLARSDAAAGQTGSENQSGRGRRIG